MADMRRSLELIRYDAMLGLIVATDGHRLHLAPFTPEDLTESGYLTPLGTPYTEDPGEFPNWERCMPAEVRDPVEFDLDAMSKKPRYGGQTAVMMLNGEGFNLKFVQDAINGPRGYLRSQHGDRSSLATSEGLILPETGKPYSCLYASDRLVRGLRVDGGSPRPPSSRSNRVPNAVVHYFMGDDNVRSREAAKANLRHLAQHVAGQIRERYEIGRQQCSHWEQGQSRCKNNAEVWIYAPDGKPVPGGWSCQPCADSMIKEYEEKMGEHWTAKPLRWERGCMLRPKARTFASESDARDYIKTDITAGTPWKLTHCAVNGQFSLYTGIV